MRFLLKRSWITITLAGLTLMASGQGKDEPAMYKGPVKEVIVICKTHFDLGFTRRVADVLQFYRTKMIDDALTVMDSSRYLPSYEQFRWTIPAWVMSTIMKDWNGQSAIRRQRLEDAFRSGKFVTHALPFSFESDACEPEAMARSLYFSVALSKKYHVPVPRSAKVTDVPSHSPALETVLAAGGVRFLHIGANWPSGYVRTPGLFWWEGPDGSKTLTLYSSFYGTCVGICNKEWPSLDEKFELTGVNLVPPADWKYPVWPAIIVTADNSGPPNAEQVKALFEEAARKMPGVKVRMGTLDDFADAILAEHPDLPVVKANMPDTWIHGIMSDPGGTKLSRNVQPRLVGAEILNTQLGLWGMKNGYPVADSVAYAYEKIGLYGEHTWGGYASVDAYGDAFRSIDPATYADLEASWEDKTDYIRAAARVTERIDSANLQYLSENVRADSNSVIVYNALPWARSGVAECEGKRVRAENVPPCGYKVVRTDAADVRESAVASNSIENEYFRIVIDPVKGSVVSFYDKKRKREWADTSQAFGLGQYLNERFTYEQTLRYVQAYQGERGYHAFGSPGVWLCVPMTKANMVSEKIVPYRAAYARNGHLSITRDAFGETATLDMEGDSANHLPASTLRITLGANESHVDMEVTIRNKPKDNWPEADWLCLPFVLKQPHFNVSRPLGEMDPVTGILPGANRYLYSTGHGVTLTDDNGDGVAISPIDHPLVSIDSTGIWKFSMDFVPKRPVVYINLYNNQWNTNFRYWYPGTWSSRVSISTFGSKTPKDEVIADGALEARFPLEAVAVSRESTGLLPGQMTGIRVSRKGVVVTAFGKDPYGNQGTLLRVWEQAGNSGNLTVTLPGSMHVTHAQPVNLRGEKTGDPVNISEQSFSFPLRGYAPASFILW